MRTIFRPLAVTILFGLGVAWAQTPPLNDQTYVRYLDALRRPVAAATWMDLPWQYDERLAQSEAMRRDVPILVFAAEGNPIGPTNAFGKSAREAWAPSLRQLAEKAVLLAIDRLAPGNSTFRTSERTGVSLWTSTGKLVGELSASSSGQAETLKALLAKYAAIPREERLLDSPKNPVGEPKAPPFRLQIVAADWKDGVTAWNRDSAWLDPRVLSASLPTELLPMTAYELPEDLAWNLAQVSLLDFVHGSTPGFSDRQVQTASLVATVTSVNSRTARLRLTGETVASALGEWPIRPGQQEIDLQRRGVSTQILGRAEWDRARRQFTQFEFIAVGQRWGGTSLNGRADSLTTSTIIFWVSNVAGRRPGELVPPSALARTTLP